MTNNKVQDLSLEAINVNDAVIYCFIIYTTYGKRICLTSASQTITIENDDFYPNSGIDGKFNQKNQDYILLRGIL